jgi:hypothetical protein
MLRQFRNWLNETSNTPQHLARSYLFLRKSIGVIGIALPFVLVIGTMILENRLVISDSISSYYYTVTRNILVGSLCACAIFLICYRYEHLDDFVSTVAGVSAIGVALFPTTPDNATGQQIAIGWAHGVFAACFLIALAIIALIFRKSDQKNPTDRTPEKLQRNKVYLLCSITIFACVVLLLLIALIQNLLLSGKPWLLSLHPILVLETLALWAFGFAWFVKGETLGFLKDKPARQAVATTTSSGPLA